MKSDVATTKAGVDLAVHATILLMGLMTAGAYALYKKYFANDLNSEAAQNFRQQLPRVAWESEDGQAHEQSVRATFEEV